MTLTLSLAAMRGCGLSVFLMLSSCVFTSVWLSFFSASFWRHQRVAAYVVLVVVLHHGVDYFPPPLVRASNGMDDLILICPIILSARGACLSVMLWATFLLPEPRLRLVRRQPRLRVRIYDFGLAPPHLPEGLFERGA